MIEYFEKLSYERKIDVLVATHVFNEKITIVKMDEYYSCTWLDKTGPAILVPCYSTLLTSAWDVVRNFDYCYLFRSKDFKGGQWECKLVQEETVHIMGKYQQVYAWAETIQLAICYAGLKAVGYPLMDFLKGEVV